MIRAGSEDAAAVGAVSIGADGTFVTGDPMTLHDVAGALGEI